MKFDFEYQGMLLQRLYNSEKFRTSCLTRLHPDDFTLTLYKFLWECLQLYSQKFKKPDPQTFADFTISRMPGGDSPSRYVILPEAWESLIGMLQYMTTPMINLGNDAYYLDQLKEQVATLRVSRSTAGIHQGGQLNLISLNKEIQKTLQEWSSTDSLVISDMQDRDVVRTAARPGARAITTGLPRLNRYLDGGMLEGNYGLLTACPGVGKTTALLNFCAAAASSGARALFITLEMSAPRIKQRYLAMLANINANYLKLNIEQWPADVVAQLDKSMRKEMQNRLQVVDASKKRVDILAIRNTIETWRSQIESNHRVTKMPPLLVAMDWLDMLLLDGLPIASKDANEASKLTTLGYSMAETSRIYDVGLWTATQGTREADGHGKLLMRHVSGAYHKMDSPDIALGLGVVRDANKPDEDTDVFGVSAPDEDNEAQMVVCDRDLCTTIVKNRDNAFGAITFHQSKSLKFWPDKGAATQYENTFSDPVKFEQYCENARKLEKEELERSVRVG